MYAVDMLGVLGLPEALIEDVRQMLGERARELEGAKPSPIGAVFGGSDQGAQLTHHASVARGHVADAVLQMAAGLQGYRDELGGHVTRMGETDAASSVDLTRIEASTACVASRDFTGNSSCQVPAAGGDD